MGTSTPTLNLYKPDDTELVDVEVHLGDNYDKIDAAFENLDDRVYGKLWRTSGFATAPGTSFVDAVFDASRVTNGMATGGGGDSLVIPTSGIYKYVLCGYGTGSANTDMAFLIKRVRAAVADVEVGFLGFAKPSSNDFTAAMTDEVPLTAGDTLQVQARGGDATVTYWGTSEANGLRFSLERVADLGGATPV